MSLLQNSYKTREDFEEGEVIRLYDEKSDGFTNVTKSELSNNPNVRYEPRIIQMGSMDSTTGEETTVDVKVYVKYEENNSDIETAQGEVDSEVNDIAYNAVSGTLNYIATPRTIKISVGDTINLQGLGKYLSGDYNVTEVTRNVSKSGYSHSCKVTKIDMLVNMKSSGDSQESETTTVSNGGIPTEENRALVQVHYVTAGETPYTIAKRFYGDGQMYYRLFDMETGSRIDVTTQLKVGQSIKVT